MLAREHVSVKDVFQVKYHYFWADQQGLPKWDPSTNEDQCERGESAVNFIKVEIKSDYY